MTRIPLTVLGALLALPACYESHQVLDGEVFICECAYTDTVPIPSGSCSSVSSMGCMFGGTVGSLPRTSTINVCSTVRDPDGTGTVAHEVCTTACTNNAHGAASISVTSAIDLDENPTCETTVDPILFPMTSSTALRVGHVVPDRSTVTVTVNGVSSPPVRPIPTEIDVTGNPPPAPGTTPITACSHGEHISTCSIGFSRGTIELPDFTITDGTSDNTLDVPQLEFDIGADPHATTPGWNGFWASDGTAASTHETYRIDSPDVTATVTTDGHHVVGNVQGHGFDHELSLTMAWSDLSGEVQLRPNPLAIFDHHLTIEGTEDGTVNIDGHDIPVSVALDVYVDFLEGRPLAIMGRSVDPSSHALILDGRGTFDHTGAPVTSYIWLISPTGTATGAYEIATGPIAVLPETYWRAALAVHPGLLCLLAQDSALFYDIQCIGGPPDAGAPSAPPAVIPPVSGILASMPYQSSFYRMIGIAGLAAQLDKEGPQTIFAPTDDAIAQMDPDKVKRLLDAEHAAETRAFVLGHVFATTVPQKSIAKDLGKLKPESGQPIVLTPAQVAAAVLHPDLFATGGVVHLVNVPLVK